MSSSRFLDLLNAHRLLQNQSIVSFVRSLNKCQAFDLSAPLTFEVEDIFDALSSKFSSLSDVCTQRVIKTYLFYLREEANTFIDRANLCEKLGIIPSASRLIEIRDLRNTIAHEYLSKNMIEIYKEVIRFPEILLRFIRYTENFLIRAV